jgi:transcriptional regulator with XRE-family HTH domain
VNSAEAAPGRGAFFGPLLREWRRVRRFSQLALALEAEISARHLSCLETGRARPSREMVARLAATLELPLRERNALLVAAGFAAQYGEQNLFASEPDGPGIDRVRAAVELILLHQEPFPAFVLDRYWEVRRTNRAAERCTALLLGHVPDGAQPNMLRLLLAPGGLKELLVNWEETAEDLVRHLQHQVATVPADERSRALLAEVLAYPDVPRRSRQRELVQPAAPLLTTHFRKGALELRFFSTFTHFATPQEVALDELRIECSFPADEATASRCRELFGNAEGPGAPPG